MTMELNPPTLAQMGQVFWGADWARPLGEMMHITREEVVAMDANPHTIPPGMEERLQELGSARLKEIQSILNRLRAAGLRRKPSAP